MASNRSHAEQAGGRDALQSRVLLLVAIAFLPLALMATLWLADAVNRERQRLEALALQSAADIVKQLDLQLAGHFRALETLAALPIFDGGIASGTYVALDRALAAQPLWETLVVLGPDGRQLVNVRQGTTTRSPSPDTVREVFETGRAKITDVAVGPLSGLPAVALQVPVIRDGAVRFVLSGVMDLAPFADVLRELLPADWRAVVIDRKGQIVVRTSDRAALAGQLASEPARAAIAEGLEGVFRPSFSLEGATFMAVFLPSTLTGWTVHAGVPEREVSPLYTMGGGLVATGGAVSVLIAGLLGWLLERDLRAERDRQGRLQEIQDRARKALEEANFALERRVAERTAEMEAIIAQMPAGLIMAEAPGGRIVLANVQAERLLGREVPRSPSFKDYPGDYHPLHPDGTPFAHDEIPMARAILHGETVLDREMLFLRPDGDRAVLSVNAAPVLDDEGRILAGLVTLVDITQRKQLEERQHLLLGELQHRVKNILATVTALMAQTWRATGKPETFLPAITGRIEALSRVQSFISNDPGGRVDLHALAKAEMKAHGADLGDRMELSGPVISLPSHVAQSLQLVLHELATNAIKHGALGQPAGRVKVFWTAEEGILQLEWRESGVRIETPPQRQGFGSKIIDGPMTAGGQSRVEFAPDGLRCTVTTPLIYA